MVFYFLTIIIVLIFSLKYISIKKKYNYWNRKGIKGPTPLPLVGTFGSVMFVKQSLDAYVKSVYSEYPDEKVVGLYAGIRPILLVRDLDLIKHILVKDFVFFQDRGVKTSDGGLSCNLFGSEGETWKVLRSKLTSVFTSKKLKEMLPLIKECVNNYVSYVDYLVDNNVDHEIKYLMSKYTLSVVGSCNFGVTFNVYSDDMEVFNEIARKIFAPPTAVRIWYVLNYIIPGINNLFPNIDPASELRDYFRTFTDALYRERKGKIITKKDLIDLLIELRENGHASRRDVNGLLEINIDDETIAAQVFMFYSAGFETSSTTMCYLLYELAFNQNVQDRVYQEICTVCEKYNEDINDESLKEMIYLNMVFDETLRKHTVLGTIMRKSVKDYTLPGSTIKIDKGTMVMISNTGLHNDSKYYSHPDEFNPENFSPENTSFSKFTYLPFGMGPRRCIGVRFSRLQILMGIAAFLKKFKVEPYEKTKTNLIDDPKTLTLTSPDGIWLKILRR